MQFNIDAYYKELKQAFDSSNEDICFNDDKAHNAVVMQFMFDNCSEIKMFCKQMSVLRNHFYDKQDDFGGADVNELRNKTSMSLKKFLQRCNTKMHIIMTDNKEVDDCIEDSIMKHYIELGKIDVKILPNYFLSKDSIDHFTIGTSDLHFIVRSENDCSKHSALCVFDDAESLHIYNNLFDTLSSYC